jgi:hypothetical protein
LGSPINIGTSGSDSFEGLPQPIEIIEKKRGTEIALALAAIE